MSRRIEPYDEENDEIAQEKKKIKAKMAAEAAEEAKKKVAAPPTAAAPHPGMAELEQLMTCCICMDRFRIPKMLPCQHSFCAHCLEGLYDWIKRIIKCPECRTEHHCSNPENYPTNLTLVRFMEVHIESMGGDPNDAMAPPPQLQRCGVCGDNAELAKCAHCDRKVCTDCRDGHAEILKRELSRLINQIKRGVTRLEESLGWIERNSAQLEQNAGVVKEEIQETVQRYIKEMKDREELLLNQVNTFLQTESRSMRHMQENLEEEIKSLNASLEDASKLLSDTGTSIEDLMNESAVFKDQFQKSLDFLRNFTPDAQEFTKSLRFLRGSSDSDLLHQCILAFGELHVSTMHFNRFVSNSERMATQLVERQFEATLAEYNKQQQEGGAATPPRQRASTYDMPAVEVPTIPRFESEYMTRRLGEDLREYRDRRLEASPSRNSALEFPSRSDYVRESSAPASYLARVNRLTDTSSSGTEPTSVISRTSTLAGESANAGGSTSNPVSRRQKFKDARSHTADLGALRESMEDVSGTRRGSTQDSIDGEVADALAGKGRYARRTMEAQDSTESVSGDGSRRRYQRAKTTELPDPYTASLDTPSTRAFQRDTTTPDISSNRAGRSGASACEQAIARRRRRFGSNTDRSQDELTAASTGSVSVSTRNTYSASSGARERDTSPVSVRRGRTPGLDDSDEDRRDREERMPYYSRYLANKAKSREASPTSEYRGSTAGSALSGDAAYLRKGRNGSKIGTRGSENGQLNWPRGVAATSDGRVLVADSSNHRVSVFDMNGGFIRTFGSYGSGPGEFDCLAGLAVAPDGRIVISDRYNHRICIHDNQGRFMSSFGNEGHLDGQFQYPYGVCVGNGFIFVCDKDNARIQKFTLDGRFVSKFGSAGVRANSLNNPHFVTLSATGDRVLVSDSGNNRIAVFDTRDGTPVTSISSEGTAEGQLQYPRGISVDENDYIYVGDAGNNRVQIFGNRDYRFVSSFGSWGNQIGEFKGIEGLSVTRDGHILVADRDNHRIQVF